MAYANLLSSLPDAAHAWVYATKAPLSCRVESSLIGRIRAFLPRLRSHGRPIVGEAVILGGRFIVVGGMLQGGGPLSGCSIDSLTHAIEGATQECGVVLESPLKVFCRAGDGSIQSMSRGAFRRMVRAGQVPAETPVFDLSVSEVGAFRRDFEQPFSRSWHARVFRQLAA